MSGRRVSIDEYGLPANTDAERFVLGSILIDDEVFPQVGGLLTPDDFSLEKHRRIFARIGDLHGRGERIDRVTLANELNNHGELQSVDGLEYLICLDDGLPQVSNLDSYIRILKNKSILRHIARHANNLLQSCIAGDDAEACIRQAESIPRSIAEVNTLNPAGEPNEIGTIIRENFGALVDPNAGGASGIEMLTADLPRARSGQLIIPGGRPSYGKSVFVACVGRAAAARGHRVLFYSLEMTKLSITRRMAVAIAGVDLEKWETGLLSAGERHAVNEALEEIAELPLFISDRPRRTVPSIRNTLVKMRAKGQPAELLIVDYLQLIQPIGRSENRTIAVGEISRGLKEIALEFEIPVIVPSQLARIQEREKREPTLADLRESGDIEANADLVLFLHPIDVNAFSDQKHARVALLVKKNRNGRTGRKTLLFEKPYARFVDEAPR